MASTTIAIPLIIIGLILLALAVWLLINLNQKTTVLGDTQKRDVLDEGAAPAARNQALIDAPTAVANSFGATSAQANADPIAAAPAVADAEAGPAPHPTPQPTSQPVSTSPQSEPPVPKVVESGVAKDDLRKIKGLGPKLVTMLAEQGVTTFAQIAAWTDADVERIDAQLGRFKGRVTRDQWVEQAKLLISGDKSAHAKKFGQSG